MKGKIYKKVLVLFLGVVMAASLAVAMPVAAVAAEAPVDTAYATRDFVTFIQGDTAGKKLKENITTYDPAKGKLGITFCAGLKGSNFSVRDDKGNYLVPSMMIYSNLEHTYGFTPPAGLPDGKYSAYINLNNSGFLYVNSVSLTVKRGSYGAAPDTPTTPKVKSITLSATRAHLAVGKSTTLKVKSVSPSGASKKVKWASSKPTVAKVSTAGKVTAKKVGKATITATARDGSKKTAKCTVKVYKKSTSVKYRKSLTLKKGAAKTVKAKVKPAAAYQGVKYTSANKAVAKVSAAGKIRAVAKGKTKITATTKDGMKKKAVLTLTVK